MSLINQLRELRYFKPPCESCINLKKTIVPNAYECTSIYTIGRINGNDEYECYYPRDKSTVLFDCIGDMYKMGILI